MPHLREYYRILGISPKAGIAEVKKRFRALALKFHPDRNPKNPKAAAKFREVAEAYGAICNLRSRHPVRPDCRPEPEPDHLNKTFVRENLNKFFGGDTVPAAFPSFGGPDFRYDLQIPFLAALWGLEKEIEFRRLIPCRSCQATGMQPGSYYRDCPACQGRGRQRTSPGLLKIGALCDNCQGHGKIINRPCTVCGGQGHRLEFKKHRIVIPPGVADGSRILFNGEGGEGFQHGPPGHLVVVVHVEAHEFFTRFKNDLHINLDISFAQAVLGDSIQIPTPFGARILELPRGTKSGQTFRFPGLGVPSPDNGHSGNLVITVKISKKSSFSDTDLINNSLEARTESK
jgi:molecular chaperone DnaJ